MLQEMCYKIVEIYYCPLVSVIRVRLTVKRMEIHHSVNWYKWLTMTPGVIWTHGYNWA